MKWKKRALGDLLKTYYGNVVSIEQDLIEFCDATSFRSDLTKTNILHY